MALMLCGWEGNRRSGVALAMRHRLSRIYQPTGSVASETEMSTPPTLQWSTAPLPLHSTTLKGSDNLLSYPPNYCNSSEGRGKVGRNCESVQDTMNDMIVD